MSRTTDWHIPPSSLHLAPDEVHAWRASLQAPASTIHNLRQLLSADEATKASKFYFDRDRNHYIVARGLLRTLLGRYLHVDPQQIRFNYNEYGKPLLAYPAPTPTLQFNVSHSGEFALYIFSYERHVGIDIEYMRTNIEYEQIGKHSFSPQEHAVLCSVPPSMTHQTFYNCWTRKEAYIKAKGKGLSLPLDSFDVTLRPGEPARLLEVRDDPIDAAHWSLLELYPAPDYAGALMVEGHDWSLCCWEWSEK